MRCNDRNPAAELSLDPILDTAGKLTLSVRRGTTQVLLPSALGVRTKATDLSTGLTFGTRTDAHVAGTYTTLVGKRRA